MSNPLSYESHKPDGTPLANRICPKCNGQMIEGFHIGFTPATRRTTQLSWFPGVFEISFWTGIKARQKDAVPVTTYRCQNCGYLESYALNT